MKRKQRLLTLLILLVVAIITLAGCSKCKKTPPTPPKTHTISFVTNDDKVVPSITAAEDEDIASKLPTFNDTSEFYFGGWYDNAEFSGQVVTLPTTMPTEDATYYARWYNKYIVERYLQKTDLSGYQLDKTITKEVTKGASIPSEITSFVNEVPTGYVLHEGSSTVLPTSGKDRTLKLEFDLATFTLSYNANLPDDVEVLGEMADEQLVNGVTHQLAANAFSVDGYRFMGWSLTPEGEEIIEEVTPNANVVVYAIWQKGLTDYFDGSDILYLPTSESEKAILVRGGIEKEGTYNATTKVFSFPREEGTLDGMVLGDVYFYFKEIWQTVLQDEDGHSLELKNDGTAIYEEKAGTWSIDLASGYFVLTTADSSQLFVFKTNEEGTLTFAFSDDEQGWYALKTEDSFGYDLLYLDGFGKMSVYAKSPYASDFDEWLDVYSGTYYLDEDGIFVANYVYGVYTSVFPFKLTPEANLELDGVDLKGTYVFGDYRGTFVDIDNEYSELYLDGFGKGSYYYSDGTYTVEDDEWLVDNYPTPGTYTVSTITFTTEDGDTYLFSILTEGFFITLTADFYGRYEFEVAPEGIYPGSSGDVAFMYFSGYTMYPDDHGAFNDGAIWFGNYTPKYSTSGYTQEDLPLYDWRDDGTIHLIDEEQKIYRYESLWEDVSFTFQINENNKIVWQIAEEDTTFKEDASGKIYIDKYGVGHYVDASGHDTKVEFGMNSFLKSDSLAISSEDDYSYLVLCSFLINDTYYSFTYTAPITQIGFDGTISDLKEVKYVATVENIGMIIVYEDDTVVAGLNMDIFGGTGYWFALNGVVSSQDDAYLLTLEGDAPAGEDPEETATYQMIFDFFNNLNFKLGNPDEGIYECLEFDGIVYNIETENGTLITDGYGSATFTIPGGMSYDCYYEDLGNDVIHLLYETEEAYIDWYLIIKEDGKSFSFAKDEAGTYFSYDEVGELSQDNLVILNGNDVALGYYNGYYFEGSYTATGFERTQNDFTFKEYEISVSTYDGEDEVSSLRILVAIANEEMHIGLVYFFNDASISSELIVVDEKGSAVGILNGDGYFDTTLTYQGKTINGEAYRGDSTFEARTNSAGEREFKLSVEGKSVIFFSTEGDEYIFDFKADSTDEIIMRTLEYGTYQGYVDGEINDDTLTLDGHGKATLVTDQTVEAFYEPFADKEGCLRIFDETGETILICNLSYTENSEDYNANYGYVYIWREYVATTDGTYINDDWQMLILSGYGDAIYIDEYGVVSAYEAIVIGEETVLLRNVEQKINLLVTLTNGKFAMETRDFVVSEDGVLLAYNGEGGDIVIPEEVIRIAAGVFDGVVLDHVEFNNVEIIDAYAFAGQEIDGVSALHLRIIGERAFSGTGSYDYFEEVYLPAIEEIGEAAFINHAYLEKVTLGASIKTIGAQAFASAGSSYGSLIIDLTAVSNLEALTIASDAFLALGAGTFNVIVKDIETLNEVVKMNWPKVMLENVVIWTSGSSYPDRYTLFGLTEAAVYELYEGVINKATPTEDGGINRTRAGVFKLEDDIMTIYLVKEDGTYDTTAISVDTSSQYVVQFGDDYVFSGTGYGEAHQLTISGDYFNEGIATFGLNASVYSLPDKFTAYNINISVSEYSDDFAITCNDEKVNIEYDSVKYEASSGKIYFVVDGVRYELVATSKTTCTINKLYTQKVVNSEDEKYRVTLGFDDENKVVAIAKFEVKNSYSFDEETIVSSTISDNKITLTYEAGINYNLVIIFTYDSASEVVTYEISKYIYNFSSISFGEYYATIAVDFDADQKIIEVKAIKLAASYSDPYVDVEFDVSYNEDGSATITLLDGSEYNITVTVNEYGSYQLTVE